MKQHSMAWSLIMVAGLVLAYPSTGTSQTPRENSEARRLFNEGAELQHGGNFVEAEKRFREALRRYPKAEGSDRTAYFLIDTLVRLRRFQDARTEIENFRRNYPKSQWQDDVSEKISALGGLPDAPAEAGIWNSPAELREAQALADLMRGAITPAGPPNKIYSDEFPRNASMRAESLRQIILRDPDQGIEEAKQLLKVTPSDPAVVANLGTIANSDSRQAVPFLLSVWVNTSATPNVRNNAFFWFSRRNPNKEEVANAIMNLLTKRETEGVASEALYRMTVADHRAVLEKIVTSSNPEKFVLMEKIYRNGSVLLRTDLLMFLARLDDSRAVPFIVQAAQNDSDLSVRRAAAQALGNRKDVDVGTLQNLMRSAPPTPRAPQPPRFAPANGAPIAIPGSAIPGSGSAFPILVP
jgi:tetratricopeptide (TPR) repeat protein